MDLGEEEEDDELGDDDAGEHGEGVDGGVAYGGVLAWKGVGGVGQGHGIGHGST